MKKDESFILYDEKINKKDNLRFECLALHVRVGSVDHSTKP